MKKQKGNTLLNMKWKGANGAQMMPSQWQQTEKNNYIRCGPNGPDGAAKKPNGPDRADRAEMMPSQWLSQHPNSFFWPWTCSNLSFSFKIIKNTIFLMHKQKNN